MAARQDQQHSDSIPAPEQVTELTPESVPDRRAYPRHDVDCSVRVLLLLGEREVFGRISSLSLGGCLITSEKRLGIGIQLRVEVTFQLRGIVFRLAGVTVSNRNANAFAIRFLHVPAHRLQELAAVLAEEAAIASSRQTAEASKPAVASSMASPSQSAVPAASASGPTLVRESATPNAKEQLLEVCAAIVRSTPPAKKERRSSGRHAVDTRANLLLVKSGITMPGRILNLSLGGCQIRMEERFNVGIYVRVEAEFFLHGLPFRVGGVSQAIIDKFTIGIRFLDMSERRRHHLAELIEEIAEAKAEGFDPTANAPTATPESQ